MDCRQPAQVLLLAWIAACSTTSKVRLPVGASIKAVLAEAEAPITSELWPAWDSSARLVFEQRVRALQAGPAPEWDAASLKALTLALDDPGPRATRAAVLLAHDTRDAASESLLARLEQRHKAPSRGLDAGDIVAAAGLGRRTLGKTQVQRLLRLLRPGEPHPDLEVRVECAASALGAGATEAAPFLIRVLRTETPAQSQDPRDWERVTTLAWAKGRAADALAAHTSLAHAFRPDGSWAHQMQSANLFARALGLPKYDGR